MPTEKQILNYIDKHVTANLEVAENYKRLQSEQPENSVGYAIRINGYVSVVEALEDMKKYITTGSALASPKPPVEESKSPPTVSAK